MSILSKNSISSYVYKYETNEELHEIINQLDANLSCNRSNKSNMNSTKGIVTRIGEIISDEEHDILIDNVVIVPLDIIMTAFNLGES